jgi:DNA-binding response OmpR family regulator
MLDRRVSRPAPDIRQLMACCVGVIDAGGLDPDMAAALPAFGRSDGRAALPDTVRDLRPDYVILAPPFAEADLLALAAGVRTSSLAVLVVTDGHSPPDVPLGRTGAAPTIEVETGDLRQGGEALVLRLRALLRRCRPHALSQRIDNGAITLDEARLTLTTDAVEMPLSLEDFRLIGPFFDRPEHVWSREDLLTLVYGSATENAARTVDVKLNRARRRLRDALGRDPILTVRGEGYRLVPAP